MLKNGKGASKQAAAGQSSPKTAAQAGESADFGRSDDPRIADAAVLAEIAGSWRGDNVMVDLVLSHTPAEFYRLLSESEFKDHNGIIKAGMSQDDFVAQVNDIKGMLSSEIGFPFTLRIGKDGSWAVDYDSLEGSKATSSADGGRFIRLEKGQWLLERLQEKPGKRP